MSDSKPRTVVFQLEPRTADQVAEIARQTYVSFEQAAKCLLLERLQQVEYERKREKR